MSFFKKFCSPIAVCLSFFTYSDAHAINCSALFSYEGFPGERDRIFAEGIKVTGDFDYPLPLVLNHLSLNEALVNTWPNKDVLLIGEGFSGLLPHLVDRNVAHIRAVDLWYESDPQEIPEKPDKRRMLDFMKRYAPFLVKGDARDLDFPDASQDVVLSHLLVNNLSVEENDKVIFEAFRVLRVQGQARLFGFGDGWDIVHHQAFAETLGASTEVIEKELTLYGYGRPHKVKLWLLIFSKN